MQENFYKIPEIARMIDVSERTIRRYLKAGRFPNARRYRGKTWLIPMSDVAALGEDYVRKIDRTTVCESVQKTWLEGREI